MNRRAFVTGLGAVLAAPLRAETQQVRVRRIGFLWGFKITPEHVAAFERGLRELGWINGKNIVIEYRSAEGDLSRLPALAAELVSSAWT